MNLLAASMLQAKCIGPSRKRRAQDDKAGARTQDTDSAETRRRSNNLVILRSSI